MHDTDESTSTPEVKMPHSINQTTTTSERPEAPLEKSHTDLERLSSEAREDENTVYPTGLKAASIMVALYLAMFLVALVRIDLFTAAIKPDAIFLGPDNYCHRHSTNYRSVRFSE